MKETVYIWTYFYPSEYTDSGWGIAHISRHESYEVLKDDKYFSLSAKNIFLTETKIEVELPSFDHIELQAKGLRAELEELTAKYAAGKAMLEDRLSKLTAISHEQ